MPLWVCSWFWVLVLGLPCLSLRARRISRERALGACARDRRRAPRDQILNPLPVMDAVVRPFLIPGFSSGLQCLSLSAWRILRDRALGASARDRRRAPRDQILNPLPVIDAVVRPFVLGFSSWSPVSLAERAEDLTRENPRRLCARSSARSARSDFEPTSRH